jgi:hypothetical protein
MKHEWWSSWTLFTCLLHRPAFGNCMTPLERVRTNSFHVVQAMAVLYVQYCRRLAVPLWILDLFHCFFSILFSLTTLPSEGTNSGDGLGANRQNAWESEICGRISYWLGIYAGSAGVIVGLSKVAWPFVGPFVGISCCCWARVMNDTQNIRYDNLGRSLDRHVDPSATHLLFYPSF